MEMVVTPARHVHEMSGKVEGNVHRRARVWNLGLPYRPLKDVLLRMELDSHKRISFCLNGRDVLQPVHVPVYRQRVPEPLHSIPGEVVRCETKVVKVDGDSLSLQFPQHIRRSEPEHL